MGKGRKALLVVPQGREQASSESVTIGILYPIMPNGGSWGALKAQVNKCGHIRQCLDSSSNLSRPPFHLTSNGGLSSHL